MNNLDELLHSALERRKDLLDGQKQSAFRLFNGFLEGYPDLVADLYARTLVLFNYANRPEEGLAAIQVALDFYHARIPWLASGILKTRQSPMLPERRGIYLFGSQADREIKENGIRYAIDLTLTNDASFYLDTRNLRLWAMSNLTDKTVLNTFAYTGSLGVAATASGARRVLQCDLDHRFLNIAKTSYTLNGYPIKKTDFITGDFFTVVNRLKREGLLFDCVFVDPPFFSLTAKGRVDLNAHSQWVINKLRPLVADEGWLVVVNNALFLSGSDFMQILQNMCLDGFLSIEQIIPVPPDVTGYPETIRGKLPTDPAPFNHATKIILLRIRRKDKRKSGLSAQV